MQDMKKGVVTGISLSEVSLNYRGDAGHEMLPIRAITRLGKTPCVPLLQADASSSGVCLWWDPKLPNLTNHWEMTHMITCQKWG